MRSSQRSRWFGLAACTVFFVTVLAAGPALAGEVPQATEAAPSAVSANCGVTGLNLTSLTAQTGICPAAQPENPAPEFMAKPPRLRYCSCGCGATCTTDADCDGGVCINVITCC